MMVYFFDWKYETFDANRTKDKSKRREAFLNMIALLVCAKKQRLIGDIKAVYFTPDAKTFALGSGNPTLISLFSDDTALDSQVVALHYPLKAGDDETILRPIVDGLLTAMKRKSDQGFYWLNKLVLAAQGGVAVAKRKQMPGDRTAYAHPMYLFSELCYAYATKGARLWDNSAARPEGSWCAMMLKTLDVCFKYDKHFGLNTKGVPKHRDWIVFTIWPLLYCVRNIDWDHNHSMINWLSQRDAEDLYAMHRRQSPRVFEDFIYDQHTARGRTLGRGPQFFAEQAALVLNEDETVSNPAYRLLYNEFKKSQTKRKVANVDDDNDDEESAKVKRAKK
jgi:hypothetical protein